ncbi:hypothetical protein KBY92_10430 [Synechococcus sp. Cruz CV-v-12]|nr:hypothetical protein [Synechococcus sp. Cruz CV-v-12]
MERPAAARAGRRRPQAGRRSRLGAPAALVVGLLLVAAAVIAPERPEDQGEICLRHNSPAACRVW